MKKRKLLVLGLIALVLAGGLALASCGEQCSGGGSKCGRLASDCGFNIVNVPPFRYEPSYSYIAYCAGGSEGGKKREWRDHECSNVCK